MDRMLCPMRMPTNQINAGSELDGSLAMVLDVSLCMKWLPASFAPYKVQCIPGREDQILMCSVKEGDKTVSRDWFGHHNLPLSYGGLIYFHCTMPKLLYSCGGQVRPLFDVCQRKVQYQLVSEL